MATIRKRGTRYQAIVRKKGHAPATRTFTRRRDAERWATHTEAEMEQGLYFDARPGQDTTLAEALDRYGKEVTPRKRGWRGELSKIRVLRRAPFARLGLALVKPRDVAAWRDKRLRDGRSPSTVRNDLVVLSGVYQHAIKEWGLVQDNPARSVQWPAPGAGRQRRLLDGEERALLKAAEPVEQALLIVLLETGMRLGEALSITHPGSLDLTGRTVTLEQTKNGTRRVVPLSRRALKALRSVPVDIRTRRLFPWDSSRWGHRMERITSRAGVSGLRTHDLRHEAVSRLFERGFNVMEVSAISGHKTLAMLQRYTHLQASDLVRRLDQVG